MLARQQSARDPRVLVLMFHSISNGDGPTCMPPQTFRAQLGALKDSGYREFGLSELQQWLESGGDLAERGAVITFDDAFEDFALEAAPQLDAHGFRAAVFAPTALIGSASSWEGGLGRPLMSWGQMRTLSSAGFEFGSHADQHLDLTTLAPRQLTEALARSRQTLESQLAVPAPYFAPPFGRTNAVVRQAIQAHYSMAFGVRLGRAGRGADRFDIPRIEMHYFRDIRRWRAFLEGRAEAYFALRKAARSVRALKWGA